MKRILLFSAALAGVSGLAGPLAAQDSGSFLGNLFRFGGTTVPPAAPAPVIEVECPPVGVIDGGAAMRAVAGDTVRSQISIGRLARECTGRPDGSIAVKVGVEGLVLLGTGGASGRYDTSVRFVVKRGDRVFMTKTRRVAGAIPAGDTQGTFTVVEDGLVVPPGVGEYEIDVGLGGATSGGGRGRGR
jgi:hypothetical protein